MKITTTLLSLATLLWLSACSSNTVEDTRYYLLNHPQANSAMAAVQQTQKDHKVIINVLELPKYLNQAQMVMQMSNHQLHYAHFHMWAEPLKAGFSKALESDLNSAQTSTQFSLERQQRQSEATILMVKLAFFHVSSDSTVVLSGHYWYDDKTNNDAQQAFYFQQSLQQDGYPHAVTQMRQLVTQLAQQITDI